MEVAGAQRVLLSQANWFHVQGYPVQAVFLYDKQGLAADWRESNPFPVVSLNAWRQDWFPLFNLLRLARGMFRLFQLLRKGPVAIVTFTPHSNLLGLPIAWLAGVSLRVGTHHGHIEGASSLAGWLHGKLTNSRICSKMVAVSAQVREYALSKERVIPSKLVVIENGIEPLKIQTLDLTERNELREQVGIPPNGLMYLTVGRLTIQKGHTVLLDAITKLDGHQKNVAFVFAGEGPQKDSLKAKAIKLGVYDQVRFLGMRNDINKLLLAADVFVQPSLWEGLSLALLEALLAGLPVLATSVEGVVDVAEHEESALLVPPNDASALANAIERLSKDAQLRDRLGRAGRQRAEGNYSVGKMCQAYEALLLDLLKNVA